MSGDGLRRRIESFPRWHYEFELGGIRTPIFNPKFRNRHEQRKRYFFDPLVALSGGSLAGKRVLDLGCNAGFWSLCAIQAGCEFVLGIDARNMHVEQAHLVFETKGVPPERYRFVQASVLDTNTVAEGAFDVVLCLGLLYHISEPFSLIELIARCNTDLLVVDTDLANVPGSWLKLGRERLEEPSQAADYELVAVPSKQAVLDLVRQFGYSVVTLKPRFTSYEGCLDYRIGVRRAFLCAKRTPVAASALLREPERSRWPFLDPLLWAGWRTARSVQERHRGRGRSSSDA